MSDQPGEQDAVVAASDADPVTVEQLKAAGSSLHFHQGDGAQNAPTSGPIPTPALRVPGSRPRWGRDADGNPIEAGPEGLIITDPLTGAAEPLTEESAARAERNQKLRAKQAESRWGAAETAPPPPPKEAEPTTEPPKKPEPRPSAGKAPSS